MPKTSNMGRPKLFKNRVTMSFDIDKSVYDQLVKLSADKKVKKSVIIRDAIKEYLGEMT